MSIFALLAISFAASLGGGIFSKLCSNAVVGRSVGRYAVFMAVNGVIACVFFYVSGGFRLELNLPTLIYAVIYAVIVLLSLVGNTVALKYINIAALTVIMNALGLVATSAMGAWIFGETVDARRLLRIAIMLVSVVLFAAEGLIGSSGDNEKPRFSAKTVAVILVLLIANCGNTVVTKCYSLDSRVLSDNSFFFFTNVVLIAVNLLAIAITLIKKRDELREIKPLFRPLNLLALSGNTVCSNIGSLVSLLLLARMDVTVLSPLSSALGILVGFLGSLIFREKMGWLSYLGVLGAVVAVII